MAESEESPAVSHSHLFTQVTSGKRDQTARTVLSPEVSLGMVDPSTGR